MKKETGTILLMLICLTSFGQVIEREEGIGYLIVTPSLAHNLSDSRLSTEAGITVGVEAISNQSSLSLGYIYRRYWDVSTPSYHAINLSSAVYPFLNFPVGASVQADLRRGEYQYKELSADNTRGSSVRNKVFGSIGLICKVDQNFRVETLVMFHDYAKNHWHDPITTNPYGKSPIKVRMSYTIPVLTF